MLSMENTVKEIIESYKKIGGINHIDGPNLPSRQGIITIISDLESLVFPGYHEEEALNRDVLHYTTTETVNRVCRHLVTEIEKSLNYQRRLDEKGGSHPEGTNPMDESTGGSLEDCNCRKEAETLTCGFLAEIPNIRAKLKLDVEAAFAGDPAAKSRDEVILSYPGVEAILIHRIANALWTRKIPLIPRMMSEYIHGKTGIDLHPGAAIGDYFFIDHATGVVIGETTVIGNRVKIYQGVTIGALSVKKDEANVKRHPTIEDDVTIYSGATILGGNTVIGRGSVIGGNVWITTSVPPGSKIYNKPSDYIMKQGKPESNDYSI